MKKRCVKYGAAHLTQDCPVTRPGGTRFLKCVLCDGAHPANARKCTVRQAAIEVVKKKQQLISHKRTIGEESTVGLGPISHWPLQLPPAGPGLNHSVTPACSDGQNQRNADLEHPPLMQLEQPASAIPLDQTAFELSGYCW